LSVAYASGSSRIVRENIMTLRSVLLLALVPALGCHGAAPSDSAKAAAPAKVTAVSPKKMSLTRIVEQPGTIHPFEETPLMARLTGYIRKIHVDKGDKVRGPKFDAAGNETEPGQVLAELDVPEMEDEAKRKRAVVRQTEAEIEQAKKSLASAEASVATADAMVVEAKAGLSKAQANLDRWDSESKRITELVRTGVMDRQTKDETDNQRRAAAAGREEAVARVGSSEALARKSRAERDKSTADVHAAEARCDVARADSRQQETMLKYAMVRAPFDGVIVRRYRDTGYLVQAGKPEPLFVVAQQDRVRVTVEVPEADAVLVKDGAKATIVLPSLKGRVFEGKVSRTAWGLDAGSRTLLTEIDLGNPDGQLRPAMYVTARIAAPLPETYVVPAAALAKMGDGTVCFRIDGGKVVRTPVRTGATVGDQTQVLKLMKSGSEWSDWDSSESLASPAASLTDGQSIDVSR
jgi:RND family efflux transporter MFP subunit